MSEEPVKVKEHWVYLEEFCYVCLKRRVYFFCMTPVPRLAALCCPHCKEIFEHDKDLYVDRHNQFMKILREEEVAKHEGAVSRALRRMFPDDPGIR